MYGKVKTNRRYEAKFDTNGGNFTLFYDFKRFKNRNLIPKIDHINFTFPHSTIILEVLRNILGM